MWKAGEKYWSCRKHRQKYLDGAISSDTKPVHWRGTPLMTCGRKYCTLLPTHRFSGKSLIFAWWFPVLWSLWSKCSTSILVYSHALRQTHWDSYSGCRPLGWEISSGRKTSQLGPIQNISSTWSGISLVASTKRSELKLQGCPFNPQGV